MGSAFHKIFAVMVGLGCGKFLISPAPTLAQILPDRTLTDFNTQLQTTQLQPLPTSTLSPINPENNNTSNPLTATPTATPITQINIQQGTASGANLFHSFQDFSVPRDTIVNFQLSADQANIQRIFSRVVGDSSSQIDGTLQAPVSLFLLNPNGIIFGETAAIAVNGAFVASTADRVNFSDGATWANNTTSSAVLSVGVPIGLGLGSPSGLPTGSLSGLPSGAIVNRSQAQGVDLTGAVAPVGLNGAPGQPLALVGSTVSLEGGLVTAIDGQVSVIGLAQGDWSLVTGDVSPPSQGLIAHSIAPQTPAVIGGSVLFNSGTVSTTGLSGGLVQVYGANILLENGSKILADTGGNIRGGAVLIRGDRFALRDQSAISTSNFGTAATIGITLNLNEAISIEGIGPYVTVGKLLTNTFTAADRLGGLYALVAGQGNGGNIDLNAPSIVANNGASIFTTVVGLGEGGDITFNATDSVIAAAGSFILTSTVGPGRAGDLVINTPNLLSIGGGVFNTSPSGPLSGDGGNFRVRAQRIEVRETAPGSPIPGGILATTLGTGNAGNMDIVTDSLVLRDGGQVSVSSSGAGRGGDLTIVADTIDIGGPTADGRFLAGIFASSGLLTVDGTRGNAGSGSVNLTARRLSVRDGGQISAAIGNGGNAGDINLNITERLELQGIGTGIDPSVEAVSFGVIGDGIIPTGLEANTSSSGHAGDVNITTDRLILRDGAEIGVRGTNTGDAGNLSIQAQQIELENRANITAATASGAGGNLALRADRVILRNDALISATAGGSGDGGNLQFRLDESLVGLDRSTVLADANLGRGGNIQIQAQGIFLSQNSRISASSNFGVDGSITLRSPDLNLDSNLIELSSTPVAPGNLAADPCVARQVGDQFVLRSQDGIANTPETTSRQPYTLMTPIAMTANPETASPETVSPEANLEITRPETVLPGFSGSHTSAGVELVATTSTTPTLATPTPITPIPTTPPTSWQPGDPIQEAMHLMQTDAGRLVLATTATDLPTLADTICRTATHPTNSP